MRRGELRLSVAFVAAVLFGAAAFLFGWAYGGEAGPEVLGQAPALSAPSMTFKMERNANTPGGQEFIRLRGIDGVYREAQADGSVKNVPQTFTIYQRISSVDSIRFDTGELTSAFETTRVTLTNGGWYVVTDSVDEVWSRLSEAGGYEYKPAKGEAE